MTKTSNKSGTKTKRRIEKLCSAKSSSSTRRTRWNQREFMKMLQEKFCKFIKSKIGKNAKISILNQEDEKQSSSGLLHDVSHQEKPLTPENQVNRAEGIDSVPVLVTNLGKIQVFNEFWTFGRSWKKNYTMNVAETLHATTVDPSNK